MRQLAILTTFLLGRLVFGAQNAAQSESKMPRRVRAPANPECAQGVICFAGEVREGQEFRRRINDRLAFVLQLPGGIDVVAGSSAAGCTNCEDYQALFALLQTDTEKYVMKLESLAKGHGRLWITDSKVTHSHGSVNPGNRG